MGKSAGKGLIWGTYVVIIGTNKRKYLISQSELDSLHFDLFSFLYTNAAPALTRSGVCIYLQSLAEFAATGGKKTKIIFRRGLYLAENTTQAASGNLSPEGTNSARADCKPVKKVPRTFLRGSTAPALTRGGVCMFPTKSFAEFAFWKKGRNFS